MAPVLSRFLRFMLICALIFSCIHVDVPSSNFPSHKLKRLSIKATLPSPPPPPKRSTTRGPQTPM
ncbi:hypothetical protein NC651_039595 [Populus alba x Populus x berolinensis]|nr:hypothetical protein NC651_039595 [Populus alba x Populus x berolinensis]